MFNIFPFLVLNKGVDNMLKCKRCKGRVPNQHKDEFDYHEGLCRKCWHILHSLYKNLKNKQSDLRG